MVDTLTGLDLLETEAADEQPEAKVISSAQLDTIQQKSLQEWIERAIESDRENLSSIKPEELKLQIEQGLVMVSAIEHQNNPGPHDYEFVGFTRVIPYKKFCIISTTYVDDSFRGKGIAKELLQKAIERFPDKWQYLETQNPGMYKIATGFGFKSLDTWRQQLPAAEAIIRSNLGQALADIKGYTSGYNERQGESKPYYLMARGLIKDEL